MAVRITWDVDRRPSLDERAMRAAVEGGLEHGGRRGLDVDVILVDDPMLTDLHARHLGDPTPTDVLAFDLGEDGSGPAAEVYVSVDCAERVAASRGVDPEREIALYLIHGALHLCGFEDDEQPARAAMREAERLVMERLGYPPDEGAHEAP